MTKICSICQFDIEPLTREGKVIWADGNNAWPVNEGRCCNICNDSIVTPARIIQMARRENKTEQIKYKTHNDIMEQYNGKL